MGGDNGIRADLGHRRALVDDSVGANACAAAEFWLLANGRELCSRSIGGMADGRFVARRADQDLGIPAILNAVRLDEADIADRRHYVRVEISLWLSPLLAAVLATAVLRPHSCRGTPARRRG